MFCFTGITILKHICEINLPFFSNINSFHRFCASGLASIDNHFQVPGKKQQYAKFKSQNSILSASSTRHLAPVHVSHRRRTARSRRCSCCPRRRGAGGAPSLSRPTDEPPGGASGSARRAPATRGGAPSAQSPADRQRWCQSQVALVSAAGGADVFGGSCGMWQRALRC